MLQGTYRFIGSLSDLPFNSYLMVAIVIELIRTRSEKHADEEEEENFAQAEEEFQGYTEAIREATKRCKKCDRKIKDKKHQSGGRHLDTCYICYLERKAERRAKDDNLYEEGLKDFKKEDNANSNEKKRDRKGIFIIFKINYNGLCQSIETLRNENQG